MTWSLRFTALRNNPIPPSENGQGLGNELATRWGPVAFSDSSIAAPPPGDQQVGAEWGDLGKERGGGKQRQESYLLI